MFDESFFDNGKTFILTLHHVSLALSLIVFTCMKPNLRCHKNHEKRKRMRSRQTFISRPTERIKTKEDIQKSCETFPGLVPSFRLLFLAHSARAFKFSLETSILCCFACPEEAQKVGNKWKKICYHTENGNLNFRKVFFC